MVMVSVDEANPQSVWTGDEPAMKERRTSPRVLIHEAGLASKVRHLLLSALGASGSKEWDPVFDLSVGGVCFLTERELSAEQDILLTLRIDKHIQPIEMEGRVLRVSMRDDRGRCRVAVMFSDYREDARKILEWFEKQYAARRKKLKDQRAVVEEVRKQKGLDKAARGHTPKLDTPLLKCAVTDQASARPAGSAEAKDE